MCCARDSHTCKCFSEDCSTPHKGPVITKLDPPKIFPPETYLLTKKGPPELIYLKKNGPREINKDPSTKMLLFMFLTYKS